MILKVQQWVDKRLEVARMLLIREQAAALYVHEYGIKLDNIEILLKNAINSPRLDGYQFTQVQKNNAIAAGLATYTTASVRQNLEKYFADADWDVDPHPAGGWLITFYHGAFSKDRQIYGRTGKMVPQKLHSAVMADLWRGAVGNNGANSVLEMSKSERDAAVPHRGQANHGVQGKTDKITEIKGTADQTTIARLSLAEGFDANMADIKLILEGEGTGKVHNKMVDKVMRTYQEAFDTTYHIKDIQDMDTMHLKRDLIVQCEYGTSAQNHDRDIREADVKGLRAFMQKQEDAIKKGIAKDSDEMIKLEGSKSPMTKSQAIVPYLIISRMFRHKSRPDMRLKVNKNLAKLAKKNSGKSIKVGDIIKAGSAAMVKKQKGTKPKTKRRRGRAVTGTPARTMDSPIALRNLLNEMLPQMVASKMTAPALRFRTGRFANSTKVEMVTKGTRGGTYIDYSYMKMPYQTFEPGFKQGSTARDPRKIIGESIRELAMGLIGRQPTAIRRI